MQKIVFVIKLIFFEERLKNNFTLKYLANLIEHLIKIPFFENIFLSCNKILIKF